MAGTHLAVGGDLTNSYIRKKSNYSELQRQCGSAEWTTILLYVEVAALGHANTTWGMMSKAIGMKKPESKRLILKCRKIALRCSYHNHQCRKLKEWTTPSLAQY